MRLPSIRLLCSSRLAVHLQSRHRANLPSNQASLTHNLWHPAAPPPSSICYSSWILNRRYNSAAFNSRTTRTTSSPNGRFTHSNDDDVHYCNLLTTYGARSSMIPCTYNAAAKEGRKEGRSCTASLDCASKENGWKRLTHCMLAAGPTPQRRRRLSRSFLQGARGQNAFPGIVP
jgi:hypothetical protein